MSDVIKFTPEELQSIAKLQSDYQQQIYTLGQLELEQIDLSQQLDQIKDQKNKLLESWKNIQQEENNLINNLSQKYGEGSLNVKDGTFRPLKVK